MNKHPGSPYTRLHGSLPRKGSVFVLTGFGLTAALVLMASLAHAAPTATATSAGADTAAGAKLAREGAPPTVPACMGCHGAKGEGVGDFPPLAHSPSGYLGAQLDALASGSRQNAIMGPIAKAMTPAQRKATATYYASLPLAAPAGAALDAEAAAIADEGTWLVRRGRWSDHVPACVSCHGPAGEGAGDLFPPIAGMTAAYMQQQIQSWKDGTRPTGPLGLMKVVAQKLSAEDLTAVASHFAMLRPPASSAASASAVARPAVPSTPLASAPPAAASAGFLPPNARAIPDTPMGQVIRRGEQIFLDTRTHAPQFVGNALNCVNCHLDAGRLADSAPMWGAYPLYPAYRNKTKHVDTFSERLRGCFAYSMNGKAPPEGGEVLVALEAYAYWMARGAPTGEKLPGAGYPKLPVATQKPDFARGATVYEANCALCHGANGQGTRNGKTQVFPPLWGPQSFNWGAGMHSVDNAAAFIKANMPLGLGGSLSEQQAWDVAWFMNSHERPQDPRFTGDIAQTRKQFHDSPFSRYGTGVDGRMLGAGTR